MSEGVASPPGAAAAAEEGAAAGAGGPADGNGGPNPAAREVRCSDCIVWNRQQTWLCVVPLFIGFVGLGLSLMLLKWIVVGSVKEYVPTDLMDSKGIEQDPFFLSKQPTTPPKSMDTTTTSTTSSATSRTPNRISTRLTTMTRAPTRFPGTRGPIRANPPRSTTARHTVVPPTLLATTTTTVAAPFSTTILLSRPAPGTPGTQPLPLWPTAAYTTSSYKTYLQDSAPSWTLSPFQEASTTNTPEANTSPKYRKWRRKYSTQTSSFVSVGGGFPFLAYVSYGCWFEKVCCVVWRMEGGFREGYLLDLIWCSSLLSNHASHHHSRLKMHKGINASQPNSALETLLSGA
uniref:Neuregulin 3 n=1 Tax=Salvator merianae TaxID=96440 RepID=A0A8D0DKH2_SALMN